jgi:hypothetical protein
VAPAGRRLMSWAPNLWERLIGPVLTYAAECLRAGNATGRCHHLPLLGLSDGEAARAGGEPRDNSLSNGPHGDWPFVPADLKVSRFHGERNRT